MTAVKRKQKVSLSLDADLIQELKAGGPLSPQVNEAIRARLDGQRPSSAAETPAPDSAGADD